MLSPLPPSDRIYHEELSRQVLGAALTVHSELGPGLLESVYEACLAYELQTKGIQIKTQVHLPLYYKGILIDPGYRLDLVVDERIIVEVKTVGRLLPLHKAQLVSYLRISGFRLGLLINFNVAHLREGICRRVNKL